MKKVLRTIALVAAGFLTSFIGGRLGSVHAQTPVALQLTGNATHTTCTVVANQTTYCLASDGFYWSNAGAAYTLWTGGVTVGVTSFNGRTGAVVPVPSDYPDAVTSVNGKTGAVVISATTTLQ